MKSSGSASHRATNHAWDRSAQLTKPQCVRIVAMMAALPAAAVQLLGELAAGRGTVGDGIAENLAQLLTEALVEHSSQSSYGHDDDRDDDLNRCVGGPSTALDDAVLLSSALEHLASHQLDKHLLASCCKALAGTLGSDAATTATPSSFTVQQGLRMLRRPVVRVISRCAARRCQRANVIPAAVRALAIAIAGPGTRPLFCEHGWHGRCAGSHLQCRGVDSNTRTSCAVDCPLSPANSSAACCIHDGHDGDAVAGGVFRGADGTGDRDPRTGGELRRRRRRRGSPGGAGTAARPAGCGAPQQPRRGAARAVAARVSRGLAAWARLHCT
jgi:hypothetical protein